MVFSEPKSILASEVVLSPEELQEIIRYLIGWSSSLPIAYWLLQNEDWFSLADLIAFPLPIGCCKMRINSHWLTGLPFSRFLADLIAFACCLLVAPKWGSILIGWSAFRRSAIGCYKISSIANVWSDVSVSYVSPLLAIYKRGNLYLRTIVVSIFTFCKNRNWP